VTLKLEVFGGQLVVTVVDVPVVVETEYEGAKARARLQTLVMSLGMLVCEDLVRVILEKLILC
jgi:hypothetical protein